MLRQRLHRLATSTPAIVMAASLPFTTIVTLAGGLSVVDFCVMWFVSQALAGGALLAWHYRDRLARWKQA